MTDTQPPAFSIVVPNWNGREFLREGLTSLLHSGRQTGRAFELIVVDDASEDDSVEIIRSVFADAPESRLLVNDRNQGFAVTSNRGLDAACGRVVVMINNDVETPPEFLSFLVAPFFEAGDDHREAGDDHRCAVHDVRPLFAVGARTVEGPDGPPNHLCMRAAWRRGGIGKEWSDPAHTCETTYAQAGAAAYDRDLLRRLGGFDPIFAPGYWEDYDVAYRAVRSGWRVLYMPEAVAWHRGRGSMTRRYGRRRLNRIEERNRLWFNWLNLDFEPLLFRHLAALPWVFARDVFQGGGRDSRAGLTAALAGLPRVLARRRERRRSDPPRLRSTREMVGRD